MPPLPPTRQPGLPFGLPTLPPLRIAQQVVLVLCWRGQRITEASLVVLGLLTKSGHLTAQGQQVAARLVLADPDISDKARRLARMQLGC